MTRAMSVLAICLVPLLAHAKPLKVRCKAKSGHRCDKAKGCIRQPAFEARYSVDLDQKEVILLKTRAPKSKSAKARRWIKVKETCPIAQISLNSRTGEFAITITRTVGTQAVVTELIGEKSFVHSSVSNAVEPGVDLVIGTCSGLKRPGAMKTLTIGIPACDSYLRDYMVCLQSKIPEASRAVMERGLRTTAAAWKKAAETPEGRKALANACKTASFAASRAMKAFGCKWSAAAD